MRRSRSAIILLSLLVAGCAGEQAAVKRERADSHYNLGLAHLAGGEAKQAIG